MKKNASIGLVLAAAVGLSQPAWADGTLDRIRERGTITLGYRDASPPLSYLDANLQPIGYHIDICNRIVDAVRTRLKLPRLKIELQAVTSQNRIPLVRNGAVDMVCGSSTNNAARARQVAFAPTTYVANVRMAVKTSSGITSIAQLDGKPVSTTTGTTSVQLLRTIEKDRHINFREVYGKDHADSFLMLETGRAVAFVMDDNLLAGLIVSARNPSDYAMVGEVLSIEPIAIMIRKNDLDFKKLVDATVIGMMKSGEITALYDKWFMAPIPPGGVNMNLPMGDKLKDLIAHPNDAPAEAFNKR